MPWGQPIHPNLRMGNLHTIISDERPVTSHSYHLEFLNHMVLHGYNIQDYQAIIGNYGLGDFIFAIPPLREIDSENDNRFRHFLKLNDVHGHSVNMAFELRHLAQDFIRLVSQDLDGDRILIFCPMYRELTPSLVLAKKMKQANNQTRIIFATDILEGSTRQAILSQYEFVDEILSSDPERSILSALRKFDGTITGTFSPYSSSDTSGKPLSFLKTPNYGEFFKRLEKNPLRSQILERTWLPYEFSRGCWWGEKSKCAFCALTKSKVTYREREVDDTVDGMVDLAMRHGILKFQFFDWITPRNQLTWHSLYQRIKDEYCDFTIYFQSRVTVTKAQLQVLKGIGAVIQFGVESLDTAELKRINKGSTALQNIRALKWCAELGLRSEWNLLFGFPGEHQDKYTDLAELLPSLYHLYPPSFNRFRLQKMSPFFEAANKYGIKIIGPLGWYESVYSEVSTKKINQIAEEFDFEGAQGYKYYDGFFEVKEQISTWNTKSRYSYRKLVYMCGPSYITIVDLRFQGGRREFRLSQIESVVYLLCDSGASATEIFVTMQMEYCLKIEKNEVLDFLTKMVRNRLMYSEGEYYLSLALAENIETAERMLLKQKSGGYNEKFAPTLGGVYETRYDAIL